MHGRVWVLDDNRAGLDGNEVRNDSDMNGAPVGRSHPRFPQSGSVSRPSFFEEKNAVVNALFTPMLSRSLLDVPSGPCPVS